jgi:hypothetical protein
VTQPTIDHVLLTRFNVPSAGREKVIRAQDGWLRKRVQLFERFCMPSVQRQTVKDTHWLIYFDPESPQWLQDWIESTAPAVFTPVFRSSVNRDELISDVRRVSGATSDVLLTTNLDNDDALAVDFVERLRGCVRDSTRTGIYFQNGVILHWPELYRRVDRFNAFCSVAESWEDQ